MVKNKATIKVFLEGGGDSNFLKTQCRQGFSEFFRKAGFTNHMPKPVACGGRQAAYDSFCTAIKNGEPAMLLVDSEEAVVGIAQLGDASQRDAREAWRPWQHLQQRKGDGWEKPIGSADTDCHLMVQCMENWLLADRKAWQTFFGQGFKEAQLPALDKCIETRPKQEVYDALARATSDCKTKAPYGKGEHSFKLLAMIDPGKVTAASPWALRFIEQLQKAMDV